MSKMMLLAGIFSVFFAFQGSAQTAVKGVESSTLLRSTMMNEEAIFSDVETKTFYVDFQQVAVNLQQVVVRNNEGNIVWQEDVFDLPVNTILELDFSTFPVGKYLIELKAYTGTIRREVEHI